MRQTERGPAVVLSAGGEYLLSDMIRDNRRRRREGRAAARRDLDREHPEPLLDPARLAAWARLQGRRADCALTTSFYRGYAEQLERATAGRAGPR